MNPRRALTLLELLLVTAILGLVVSLGAGAVVRAAQAEPLRNAVAGLQAADARARLIARSQGQRRIAIEPDGWWLEADGERRRLWTPPDDLRLAVRDTDGRVQHRIPLDAAGRGPDLRVELADRSGVRRLTVLGLSGQWLEDER